MKKHEWLDRLGGADPTYIEEADPARHAAQVEPRVTVRSNRRRIWTTLIAAALIFALLLASLILLFPSDRTFPYVPFIPWNHETETKTETNMPTLPYQPVGSDSYAPVVDQLRAYYHNFIEYPVDDMDMENTPGSVGSVPPTYGDSIGNGETEGIVPPTDESSDSSYEEVTDNQVAGVIEDDIIKRSSSHIFFLRKNRLDVYSIAGLDSALVGSYELPTNDVISQKSVFYLSQDCRSVFIIQQYRTKKYVGFSVPATRILMLDVSDPTHIEKRGEICVEGLFTASRLIDDRLLLVTAYDVASETYVDYNDPSTFIPQIDKGDGFACIAPEKIGVPNTVNNKRYSVLTSVSTLDFDVIDSVAMLAYSEHVYVTAERIYLCHSYSENTQPMTEIMGLYHADGKFSKIDSIELAGTVLNQYSLDEYEGILRVVTTTGDTWIRKSNASLYCVDVSVSLDQNEKPISEWHTVASVENFAPEGETVRSVRFDTTKAYVCTAIYQTDPVFYFDLSDLSNITIKDTGEIDGFSTSLIQLGDGYLLGVGEENRKPKIEVYKETEDGVVSVAIYRPGKKMDTTYKSFLIDREKCLFGFSYYDWYPYTPYYDPYYMLLQFDKETESFREIVKQPFSEQSLNDAFYNLCIFDNRAVLIDGYLYIIGNHTEDFFVIHVNEIHVNEIHVNDNDH